MDDEATTGPWARKFPRRSFPRQIALAIKTRDGECMIRYPGCTGQPDEADHIVGHADAIAAGWLLEDIDDIENGQAACSSCHGRKTQEEAARGRARTAAQRSRHRAPEQHPGLID